MHTHAPPLREKLQFPILYLSAQPLKGKFVRQTGGRKRKKMPLEFSPPRFILEGELGTKKPRNSQFVTKRE